MLAVCSWLGVGLEDGDGEGLSHQGRTADRVCIKSHGQRAYRWLPRHLSIAADSSTEGGWVLPKGREALYPGLHRTRVSFTLSKDAISILSF